ncbi:General aromatic amino acid permease [Propionibacterium australiense]|uniref:Amino acid permease, conserved site n=1 Tax=Propionibacterium australiense TaxID=119981 RepID=A0A383S884_9ACTN|nr:amino acid permease [Propionibacterium australiense]SYZ34178.1 Amino acid permease, conserved site [Propionibacterium australiense]VEH89414.1 General aromatic amino acid permease [Propionibacterium australiense]
MSGQRTGTADGGLRRGLKNRHIQLIALGGAIGTGLFYGSGESIGQAGPAIIVCYVVGGAIIFLIMRALGEMSVHHPRPGSFSDYAYEYWSERAGFVAGWNYWFNYLVVSMAELSVVGEYVQFWAPQVPTWVSSAVFLVVITAVNLVTVKAYGEIEFWLALIKVVTIIAMIVGGLLLIGTSIGGEPIGVSNLWSHGGFVPNGMTGVLLGLVVVMFSFGGVELIGITAGEADDPGRTIPRAVNGVVYRILIFYVGTITVMVALFPWDQLGSTGSPLVTIFSGLGISGAAHVLNVVVLTAAVSAFNSFLYSNGRMMYSLALQGNAPEFLARTNRLGSPYAGVLVSSLCTGVTVLLNYLFPGGVFVYIMAVATIAVVVTWVLILLTHVKFRASLDRSGERTAFPMPGHPVTSWIALAFLALIVVLLGFNPSYQVALFVGPAWLAVLLVAYEVKRRVTARGRR